MCYLTAFPGNVQPVLERLITSLEGNNDGVGFTIATKSGQLITEHAIGTTDTLESSYTDTTTGKEHFYTKIQRDNEPMEALCRRFVKLRKRHPEGPAMFHSRLATGGVEDTRGCHPFKVGGNIPNTVLAHNGIMFSTPQGDWRSDTRIFAEDILPFQFRKFWRPKVREQLEIEIGLANKIVIITTNRRFMTRTNGVPSGSPFEMFILNEEMGHYTDDGAWHSNNSYESWKQTYRSYVPYGTGSSGSSGMYQNGLWTDEGEGWSGHDSEHSGWDGSSTTGGTDSTTGKTECSLCRAFGSVDPFTEICDVCLTCNGCNMADTECQCYVPRYTQQPAGVPSVDGWKVEPKAVTAGTTTDRPAIEATASPDEQRAAFLRECWNEWETSDDPAVQHMKYTEFVLLREYEVKHNIEVVFNSLEQMEDWFAEQGALTTTRDDDSRWLATVASAAEDADAAKALAEEAVAILAGPDYEADEAGIIRKLA